MKKRSFPIKIGTILIAAFCLVAAVLFWLFVKYNEYLSASSLLHLLTALPLNI